ncbi:hypothetical protein SH467x_001076 [Pirellulaceae bacterium SH467]|jgi:DNA-directed RNA polymerase alpha subunit
MKKKRYVSYAVWEELLDQALEKIRAALRERSPAWERCAAIVAEFIARTAPNANQLLANATIYEIGLDVRFADLLYNLGYVSVRSLAGTTETELRRTPGIGETIVEQCRKVLRTLNMSFRAEVPNLLTHPRLQNAREMGED